MSLGCPDRHTHSHSQASSGALLSACLLQRVPGVQALLDGSCGSVSHLLDRWALGHSAQEELGDKGLGLNWSVGSSRGSVG